MPSKKPITFEPPKEYETSDLDYWLNHIYQLFDDTEILHLAKSTKTMVAGFGAKGLQKAPKLMLRKTTLEKLAKVNSPLNIIVAMYQSLFQKLKDEPNPQVLLWRLRQEGASPAARLATILLEKPEFFLQIRETIEQNLESKSDPFDGLVETPELETQAKFQMTIQLDAALKQILEVKSMSEPIHLSEDQSLKHVQEQLDLSQRGAYLRFAAQSEAWKQWELHHQDALWQLVMLDALHVLVQQNNEVQQLNEQIQKSKAKHETMEATISQQEQQLQRLNGQLKGLEDQLKAQKKATKEMEKERDDAINRAIKDQPAQTAQTKETTEARSFLNDPRIQIILFQERYELSQWIAPHSLNSFKNAEDLVKWLQTLNKKNLEKMTWFIDSDTCSSQEMFVIEKAFLSHKAPYRFISGSDDELLRKMICYLEGDIHYATA
jgi:hypothetical protein